MQYAFLRIIKKNLAGMSELRAKPCSIRKARCVTRLRPCGPEAAAVLSKRCAHNSVLPVAEGERKTEDAV